jgi:hypothetical protein
LQTSTICSAVPKKKKKEGGGGGKKERKKETGKLASFYKN